MKSPLEQALSYDPLDDAETITGKSYKADEVTSSLGLLLHLDHNAKKRELLVAAGDSHFTQTIGDFIAFLSSMGFEQVLCEDIPNTEDKYRIFWRAGVLVSFDSYWGDKSVNGGTAYFFFKGPREAIFGGSSGYACEIDGQPVWDGSFDVREGLRMRLDKLSAAGEILPMWPKDRWLWLLHYMDVKEEGYDHDAITASRVAKLPDHVRRALSQPLLGR